MPITKEVKLNRQIEKDERFWTACTLKKVFDADEFANILRSAFGDQPPLEGFTSWKDCVGQKEDQELRFEVAISSPLAYRQALRERYLSNNERAHLIPYIVDAGKGRTTYEGPTKVDAVFVNRKTGLSVLFESKVLSDISCDVQFDPFRNQLARNIDIMLDTSDDSFLTPDPSKRLLLLLTPQLFQNRPSTRYYGLLFKEYTSTNTSVLEEHLPHRDATTLATVPTRLGWLTFEECQKVYPVCCPWLSPHDSD